MSDRKDHLACGSHRRPLEEVVFELETRKRSRAGSSHERNSTTVGGKRLGFGKPEEGQCSWNIARCRAERDEI